RRLSREIPFEVLDDGRILCDFWRQGLGGADSAGAVGGGAGLGHGAFRRMGVWTPRGNIRRIVPGYLRRVVSVHAYSDSRCDSHAGAYTRDVVARAGSRSG